MVESRGPMGGEGRREREKIIEKYIRELVPGAKITKHYNREQESLAFLINDRDGKPVHRLYVRRPLIDDERSAEELTRVLRNQRIKEKLAIAGMDWVTARPPDPEADDGQ